MFQSLKSSQDVQIIIIIIINNNTASTSSASILILVHHKEYRATVRILRATVAFLFYTVAVAAIRLSHENSQNLHMVF